MYSLSSIIVRVSGATGSPVLAIRLQAVAVPKYIPDTKGVRGIVVSPCGTAQHSTVHNSKDITLQLPGKNHTRDNFPPVNNTVATISPDFPATPRAYLLHRRGTVQYSTADED